MTAGSPNEKPTRWKTLGGFVKSKYFSATAVTVLIAAVAHQLTYNRFDYVLVAAPLILVQGLLGWFLRYKAKRGVAIAVIRLVVPLIILSVVAYRHSHDVVWKNRIRWTLLGDLPTGIHILKNREDIWTDYVIVVKFQADPESVRHILQNGKFREPGYGLDPNSHLFEPTDKPKEVLHRITVNKAFDTVLIEYVED